MAHITEEADARFLNDVYNVVTFPRDISGDREARWFVSFGALLWYIRDHKQKKKLQSDLDISIFASINYNQFVGILPEFGFELLNVMINDITKEPIQINFRHKEFKRTVDLYFWHKTKKYYWHAYDFYGEQKKIPREYIWKATPRKAMDGECYQYYTYDNIAPFNFPKNYGTLLDIWYPGWYIPDANFGQSKAVKTIKMKSCKDMDKLNV